MNIQTTRIANTQAPLKATNSESSQAEQTKQQEPPAQHDSYTAMDPILNAATIGALVAVPTALGAVGNTLFPNAGPVGELALTTATFVATGIGAGAWALKGAKEEFNGHPILTGITTVVAGGAGALGGALLAPIGTHFGWTGAAVATGIAAVGAGVISAIGIHASKHQQ